MSKSARKSHRPDPTYAPTVTVNGSRRERDPFTPSARAERLNNERRAARARNREGVR